MMKFIPIIDEYLLCPINYYISWLNGPHPFAHLKSAPYLNLTLYRRVPAMPDQNTTDLDLTLYRRVLAMPNQLLYQLVKCFISLCSS